MQNHPSINFIIPDPCIRTLHFTIYLFLLSLIVAPLAHSQVAHSQEKSIIIPSKGEFAMIDVTKSNQAIKKIKKGDSQTIEEIIKSPNQYNPPTLYLLSNVLFNYGRKDEAMFWFYAGQLRARSDANKALDMTARQGVSVLNQSFGSIINKYAFKDVKKLKETINKVVIWDKKNLRTYNPRWISLHGLDAFSKTKVKFEPESKWKIINAKTRIDYLKGFKWALKQLDKKSS